MARTDLTVTQISRAGTTPPATVAGTADGHMFSNDGRTFLEVTNAAGAARTITFVTPGTVGDRQIEDLPISLPASATRLIGPFPIDLYNRGAGLTDAGKVYTNFEAGQEAQFTVRAYKL